PLAQRGQQRLDVLPGRDAPEQHDLAAGSDPPGELTGVAVEWLAIARIVTRDIDGREAPEPRQIDRLVGRAQAVGRRDDEHPGAAVRCGRERARVGQLAAKVEAAQEREDLAEWSARDADALGEVERRALAQHHLGAQPATVGGREQEDPAHLVPVGATSLTNSWALRVFSTSPRSIQPRRAMAVP